MNVSSSTALVRQAFGPVVRTAALCSLVALGAFSTAAQAVTVLSPASNVVVPATTAGIYINVVSGASGAAATTTGWDINPWGSGSAFLYAASSGGIVATATGPTNLALGSVVGAASAYVASPAATTFGTAAGNWSLNATNYFGFRFIGDDALLHYGFGSMIVGATSTTRTIGQLWYESAANTSITVSPVPEPSSLAMLLAGGAIGAVVIRRRRAAAR